MAAPCIKDEESLLDLVAGGDMKAFRYLFDLMGGDVFRLSCSLLCDRQAAEDVTQEAFFRLWQHAPSWKGEVRIKTWLLAVTRNLCIDAIRKRKNDTRKHKTAGRISDVHTGLPGEAENRLDRDRHRKIVRNALFLLPERQREAVTLVYYMEVHNTEAAAIMGMSVAAFDSLLARARRKLRSVLRKHQDDLRGSCIHEN